MKKTAIIKIMSVTLVVLMVSMTPYIAVAENTLGFSQKPDASESLGEPAVANAFGLFAAPIAIEDINFTGVTLSVDGVPVSPNNPIEATSTVRMEYKWEIPNSAVINAGDYYEFQLPPAFSAGTGFYNGKIFDTTGKIIGTLTLSDDGLATITFTDADFLSKPNKTGSFFFDINFSDATQTGSGRQPIDLGFSQSLEVVFDNPHVSNTMEKNSWRASK